MKKKGSDLKEIRLDGKSIGVDSLKEFAQNYIKSYIKVSSNEVFEANKKLSNFKTSELLEEVFGHAITNKKTQNKDR